MQIIVSSSARALSADVFYAAYSKSVSIAFTVYSILEGSSRLSKVACFGDLIFLFDCARRP